MIDQWPQDLVDLLTNPKPTDPVAIWIGAGLGAELGYPLTRVLVERLIRECEDTQCDPAGIHVARNYLNKARDYRMAAEQCWELLDDPARFRQVLLNTFRQSEEKERGTGLQACENILRTPFDAYVTTNYNTELSAVSQDLAGREPVFKLEPDMVYPYLDPTRLRVRCIHYIHSNVAQVDSIVLRETDFLKAYGDGSCLPEFLRQLFSTHHLLFLGTDARDDDILWVLHRMQQIFQESKPQIRYILLPVTERGAAKVHPLERPYGIRPFWYTVRYKTVRTEYEPRVEIEDRSELYRLLAEISRRTQSGWRRAKVPPDVPPSVLR